MSNTLKLYISLTVAILPFFASAARPRPAVVADSLSKSPLGGVSVFNSRGHVVGVTNSRGRMPYVSPADWPVTVRCLGYGEKQVAATGTDTVFLQDTPTQLDELVVESRQQKVMHMLAYVREYSTLTTVTDTVFLFREKMVDFMLNPDPKDKFRGLTRPRILKSKSYYRFTNAEGLDSVSDKSGHHLSLYCKAWRCRYFCFFTVTYRYFVKQNSHLVIYTGQDLFLPLGIQYLCAAKRQSIYNKQKQQPLKTLEKCSWKAESDAAGMACGVGQRLAGRQLEEESLRQALRKLSGL